ncbi:hypothetical protein M758_8G010800 [Ceratodon purpureus]|uniref:Uncharacterized protein n=1 Tax=Ceratodon purpureus TaxID=3225 RepID=A0A8T0GWC3_CERPU|nr:hypothetical protein KC19_8G011500 [Ceratodon purpureus]KAG0607225.1 hypothetical protein M758_8G010800 [Ceratodon purpureus]
MLLCFQFTANLLASRISFFDLWTWASQSTLPILVDKVAETVFLIFRQI